MLKINSFGIGEYQSTNWPKVDTILELHLIIIVS